MEVPYSLESHQSWSYQIQWIQKADSRDNSKNAYTAIKGGHVIKPYTCRGSANMFEDVL